MNCLLSGISSSIFHFDMFRHTMPKHTLYSLVWSIIWLWQTNKEGNKDNQPWWRAGLRKHCSMMKDSECYHTESHLVQHPYEKFSAPLALFSSYKNWQNLKFHQELSRVVLLLAFQAKMKTQYFFQMMFRLFPLPFFHLLHYELSNINFSMKWELV